MKTTEFLQKLDHPAHQCSDRCSRADYLRRDPGLHRSRRADWRPVAAAEKKFLQLGMDKDRRANAILILVAPTSQKLPSSGDEGVHKKCGVEFWQKMVADMREHFPHEEFTDAIVEAIERAGELLARYFPRKHDDRNELSDAPDEH
jgi:uncharacterized membrane protein